MILYTDKNEQFKCNISSEARTTSARMIIASKSWNLIFFGTVHKDGTCTIDIDKLNILREGETGTARLEVIADDNVFVPWSEDFIVNRSKSVTIDELEFTIGKPAVVVSIKEKMSPILEVKSRLILNNISLNNLHEQSVAFNLIIEDVAQKNNIDNRTELIKEVINYLTK